MGKTDDLSELIRRSNIGIIGVGRQARIIAESIQLSEIPLDVVRAFRVMSDGRTIGRVRGSTLVVLTDFQIIVSNVSITGLPLSEITTLSPLDGGRFTWQRTNGETWSFEHARGLIRKNGNKKNTDRFYQSFENALTR